MLNFFYHILGILNSFRNPCISEIIYCHLLVIFKSVVQIENSFRMEVPWTVDYCCLNFRALKRRRFIEKKVKNFVDSLYDYDQSGVTDEECSDEEEAALSLKLISQNQSVTRWLISQNWSFTLTVIVKKEKKTSTLTLILMN